MYDATHTYQQQAVATADPATLVLMLFDRILVAVTRIEQTGDREVRHVELMRAQDILVELRATLDHTRGGEIAANLDAIYEFCINELIAVTMSQDLAKLGPVRASIAGLRGAWDDACVRGSAALAAV